MNKESHDKNAIEGYDCLCTSISNAEMMFGLPLQDENVYFFMGERIIFYDMKRKLFYTNSHKCIKLWLANKKIYMKEKKAIMPNLLMDYLKNILNVGNALILCLKTECLKYRGMFLQNPPVEHYVIAAEYRESTDKIFVIDGYIPNDHTEFFSGWVSADEILLAWEQSGFSHYLLTRSFFQDIMDLEECSRINFKATISAYLHCESTNDIVMGELAVDYFIDSLNENSDFESKLKQMKIFGFTTIKRYILRYIKKNDSLHDYIFAYENIVEKWDAFCLMLYKAHITRRYTRIEKNKNFARELVMEEHDVLSSISNQMKS